MLAAGDIAQCDSPGDEATGKVAARFPDARIAALGDIAYPSGREIDFSRCFEPSWGPVADRMWPAVGNHEYGDGPADTYFEYFGRRAGPAGRGWHSYDYGGWHFVVLNSNCDVAPNGGCAPGSEQERWLRADLKRNRRPCTLVYMHHPPRSSGLHGDQKVVEPLRRVMADAGVDVLLAAHDHHYERFAPRDGIREWVVGTGGAARYPIRKVKEGSEVRYPNGYGLLALTLRGDGYAWTYLLASGKPFEDRGSGTCS